MNLSRRQWVYLALSLAGLLATLYFNLRFMAQAQGVFDLAGFVHGGYANNAAASLTNDVTLGAITFLVWSRLEMKRLGMRHWWLFVVLTLGIAFACAFPLFLCVRESYLGTAGDA